MPFGGLQSLQADVLVPAQGALDATNCVVDDGAVTGRNGYRATTTAALASGALQAAARFRPTPANAWTVAAVAGTLVAAADPSSETAKDGAAAFTFAGAFGSTDRLSMAQLGQYLYIGSDNAAEPWARLVNASGTLMLQPLAQIARGATPTATQGSLAFTKFPAAGSGSWSGTATRAASGIADWINVSGAIGVTATLDLGADANWMGMRWLLVACSPETQSGGGGQFSIALSTAAGSPETVMAAVYDTPGGDAPFAVFCPLDVLTAATRQAVRRITFTQLTNSDPFSVSGYMPLPVAALGESDYFVTLFSSATQQESAPTDTVKVIVDSYAIQFPQFHAARWHYNSLVDAGTVSTNPDTMDPAQLFNRSAGINCPTRADFGSIAQVSGTLPAGAGTTYDTVRLWRLTPTGYRLVRALGTNTGTGSGNAQMPSYTDGTHYHIYDDLADDVLSHQLYAAGGPPPACLAATARGGRLICGGDPAHPNRVSISSYVPINSSTEATASDPFAQFPAIPVLPDTDGWAFDIAPTAAEQVLWMGNGDALYILTNEALYAMADVTANAPPYRVFQRGVVGRRAAVWAEGSIHRVWGIEQTIETGAVMWAAGDGIFASWNRVSAHELSQPIRRLYQGWFAPDSTTVLAYQGRKLYAVCATRMLRYDMVTKTWTRHTIADSMAAAVAFTDPGSAVERLWFAGAASGLLYRWQPGAPATFGGSPDPARAGDDNGAAIPGWTYSTGFAAEGTKTRIQTLFVDTTGSVTVGAYKDVTTGAGRSKAFTAAGEHELAWPPDVTGYKWRFALAAANGVQVRRLQVSRAVVAGRGG